MNTIVQFFNRQIDFSKVIYIENPSIMSSSGAICDIGSIKAWSSDISNEYFLTLTYGVWNKKDGSIDMMLKHKWTEWSDQDLAHAFKLFTKHHHDMVDYWKDWKAFHERTDGIVTKDAAARVLKIRHTTGRRPVRKMLSTPARLDLYKNEIQKVEKDIETMLSDFSEHLDKEHVGKDWHDVFDVLIDDANYVLTEFPMEKGKVNYRKTIHDQDQPTFRIIFYHDKANIITTCYADYAQNEDEFNVGQTPL